MQPIKFLFMKKIASQIKHMLICDYKIRALLAKMIHKCKIVENETCIDCKKKTKKIVFKDPSLKITP